MTHRSRTALLTVSLAAGLFVAGCSSAPTVSPPTSHATTTRPPAPTVPQPVVVSDPAQPIDTKLGQTFKIRVDLDPTKDERWQVDSFDQSLLFFIGEGPDQANAAPGSPLTDLLEFRADKPGSTQIVLRYGKADTANPSDKRVTFTVNVS